MKRIIAYIALLFTASVADADIFDTANFNETVFVADVGPGQITSMAWAPDGSNRLFLTDKGGAIVIVKNGQVLAQRFATVAPVFTNSECGLLSIAFDPDFIETQFVYVFVTVSDSEQRVVRFRANGDVGIEPTIMYDHLPTLGQNHDGGALVFGPDGMMYWAIGNNGNRDLGTADDKSILAAKIARAYPLPKAAAPSDNPFHDGNGPNNDYIWARSFRNPFTMTVQPSTGLLWVNVVGDGYEQVFVVRRGDHVGYPAENPNPGGLVTISPVLKYRTAHAAGDVDERTIAAGAAVRAAGTATFTTTNPHGLRKGERVFISDIDDASFNTPAEGVPVVSIPSATQFTVAQAGAAATSGSGIVRTAFIGNVVLGGTHYDATQFPAAYRGNFFFGDFGSQRFYRVPLDDGNLPTDVQPFGNAPGSWIDVETGPDGALYYATHQGEIRRIAYKPTLQALVVSRLNTWILEGGKAVLMVSLAQAPTQNVVVNVARSGGDADVTVDGPTAFTFTPQNWNAPQVVRILAASDGDTTADVATLSVSSSGLTTATVTVHVTDPDGVPQLPGPDGGVATVDARVAPDARPGDGGTVPMGDSSGCSCRTGSSPSWPSLIPIALVIATAAHRRRRKVAPVNRP